MRKILLVGASLILLGAGCSSSPGQDYSQNSNANNNQNTQAQTPATQTESQQQAVNEAIKNNPPVQQPAGGSTQTQTQPATTVKSYTAAEVAVNNTPAKCWTIVNGNVYDVTSYASKHPGGKEAVLKLCGKDGSSEFNNQHGGQPKPEQMLAKLKIGILK